MTGSGIKRKGMRRDMRACCTMMLAVSVCVSLMGCMPGVSNDPAENEAPWLEDMELLGGEDELWDIPPVREVHPLNVRSLLERQTEVLEIRFSSSHRGFNLVRYTFYRGCILVLNASTGEGYQQNIREYFIGPYNDAYHCYRREYCEGDTPPAFDLMREFANYGQVEEYLTYCTDGSFPSFATVGGIHKEASPQGRFEYDWYNPQTKETERIEYDMYLLCTEDEREILMFANPETHMLERIIFPEQVTGENLSSDWETWSDKETFEQMLVANYTYLQHIRQVPEEKREEWEDMLARLSTVPTDDKRG